jgi:pyrroline-5-carboxylate reductase
MSTSLSVVGGGNMGSALVGGLLASGWGGSIGVVEVDETRRASLADALAGVEVSAEPTAADGVVIAVKPQDAESACRAVAEAGTNRVLSIVAGLRIERLESWFADAVAVVRAMSNTPALVGEAASALAGGRRAGESDLAWAEQILESVGKVVRVPEESLDVVTGLSGSGPGYLFYLAEAMIGAGISEGLSKDVARTLVLQTFAGSARMLAESEESPDVLRRRVTSPGGTTEAGLSVLAEHRFARMVVQAVAAATQRSRELGG